MEQFRVCPGCKANLPLTAFGKKSGPKARKDGTRSRCKQCEFIAYKDYRERNRDKVRATKRNWEKNNPDKKAEMDRRYRLKHPEVKKRASERFRINHPNYSAEARARMTPEQIERKRQMDREYAKKNPGANLKATRRYRANNPEKAKESAKKYSLKKPEIKANITSRRRARQKNNGLYYVSPKELYKLRHSPCFYCGSVEQISIDHVIPIARGGTHGIGNLVSACLPCNQSKNAKTITEWKKWKRDYEL